MVTESSWVTNLYNSCFKIRKAIQMLTTKLLLIKNKRWFKSKYSVDFYISSFLVSFSVGCNGKQFYWHGIMYWSFLSSFTNTFFRWSCAYIRKTCFHLFFEFIFGYWHIDRKPSVHFPFYIFIYLFVGIEIIEHMALTSFSRLLLYWISWSRGKPCSCGSSRKMKISKRHIFWVDKHFIFSSLWVPGEKVFQIVISYINKAKIRPLLHDVIFLVAKMPKS